LHAPNKTLSRRIQVDVNGPRKRQFSLNGDSAAVAWQGRALSATSNGVQLQNANLPAHAYRGLDLLVLDGCGAGQRRTITDNGRDEFTVAPAWDVIPDSTSVLLAFELFGDCILYRNHAEDTSVLLQIWGFLFDVTYDGNEIERSQGMWGLSGCFVQWLNNRLKVGVTFHQGVGPGGASARNDARTRRSVWPHGLCSSGPNPSTAASIPLRTGVRHPEQLF
jgi:hypothetical protein